MKAEDLYGHVFLGLVSPGTCLSVSHLWYGDITYPGLIGARVDCNSRKKSQGLSASDTNQTQTAQQKMGFPRGPFG